jgi:type I restriction enzyme S subunit
VKKDLCFGSIDELCHVEYGTRVVKKRDAGTIYPVYGGGGATFFMDEFNREDQFIISRFGMSEKCTRFVKGKFFLNDSGLSLKPKDENTLNQRYLDYQCLSLNDLFFSLGKGSAQKNLHVDSFKKLILVYHPLPVQKQIVEKLDAAFADIDKAISATEKNIENVRSLSQKYLVDIFNLGKANWKKDNLENLSLRITDGKHGDCKNSNMSGYYFLSAKDVRDGKLQYEGSRQIEKEDFEETHRRTNLESGDVLITNSGTIGRMAIADNSELTPKTTFQKSVAIIKPIHEKIHSKFLYYALKSKVLDFNNISRGAAQKNLLLRDLRSFQIKLPSSIKDQLTICNSLDQALNSISEIEVIFCKKLKELNSLKVSILNQAFSGELTKDEA